MLIAFNHFGTKTYILTKINKQTNTQTKNPKNIMGTFIIAITPLSTLMFELFFVASINYHDPK